MPTLYYDPGIWDALHRRIMEERNSAVETMTQGHWKTLEEARQLVGFLRGLDWVLETADELRTRPKDDEPE